DDVPTAKADTDAAQSGETVTGNVETGTSTHGTGAADVPGADGIASIAWTGAVGSTITTSLGVLTITDANGGYSYHANPNMSGTDTFTYTITDGDRDTSPATLTIAVTNGKPLPAPATGLVDESGLATGSNPSVPATQATGNLVLGDPNSPIVTSVTGTGGSGAADGSTHIQGTYGYLTVNSAGHYTYTLTTNEVDASHTQGATTQPGQDQFTYTVQDAYGNTNTSTITISIKDDMPTAKADTDAAQSGETVTGNVETGTSTHGTGAADVPGADGIASIAWTGAVGSTITTSLGVLTITDANGGYSYHANPNMSGTDTFTYTITDGDGDTSPATLTIDVTNGKPLPAPATGLVDESGLATGSNPSVPATQATGNLVLGDPNSPIVTSVTGTGGSGAADGSTHIQGTYGYLTVNSAGHYTYTLTTNEVDASHTQGATTQPGQDQFTYTVQDAYGNTNTSTITISIKDDVPT
ncbi:MAG: tandem-95 repeat protein, partial [Mesorhizobium sp.]